MASGWSEHKGASNMTSINIQAIVEEHSIEFRRALRAALSQVAPDFDIDDRELFRAFRRAIGRKFQIWTRVSDTHVRET